MFPFKIHLLYKYLILLKHLLKCNMDGSGFSSDNWFYVFAVAAICYLIFIVGNYFDNAMKSHVVI